MLFDLTQKSKSQLTKSNDNVTEVHEVVSQNNGYKILHTQTINSFQTCNNLEQIGL